MSEPVQDRIAQGDTWYEASKKYMDRQRARIRKNQELYHGDIELTTPKKAVQMKFNIPLAVIETEMPIISDYLPTFDIMPTDENDIEYADAMQKRKKQLEGKAKLKYHTLAAIKDSLINGDGLIRIIPKLDGDKFSGLEATPLDIFTWFPAPDATGMKLGVNCRYHIFATPVHVDMVKRQYGIEVAPEGSIDEFKTFYPDASNQDRTADCVLLKECYSMDEDTVKYPCGRYTVWANDKVLVDEALWEGAEFTEGDEYKPGMPIFRISNYGSTHSMFGIGETYLVRTQTQAINEVLSACAETIKQTGNPQRKVLKSWVQSRVKAIMGYAGEEIEVNAPNDVMWEQPPSIPASTFQFIQLTMELTDVVTGIHDVIQGKKPTGVTAASAIMALQEAAQARVRYKIANEISSYMEDIGKFIVWMIKNYDREKTSIRDTDEMGNPVFMEYDPTKDNSGRFDIEVVAGTSVPAGRVATEEISRAKFNEGIYGIEEYAKMSNEPDKQGLIQSWYERQGLGQAKQRMEELQQAQQEFGQLLQQAEPGDEVEEKAAVILAQYPEMLQTQEFQGLPDELKERLLMVFVGEQVNATPA